MHADTALTVDRTRRVLAERIWPALYSAALPLTITAHHLPGEPVSPADALAADYEPYTLGTPWGPAWSTTWFHLHGVVPAAWAGKRIEAVIDLGFTTASPGFQAEGLVYRPDGEPVKSINPRNQWVAVAEAARGEEIVDLYVEAAANPVLLCEDTFLPTPNGDLATASETPLYAVRRAEIAVLEPDVFELALDVEVLVQLQAELPATAPRRARILQALDDALDALDLHHVAATAAQARAALADVLAAPAEASAHRIAAVGHAHIDSAWLWPVRETIRKVARTTASMTELIASTDDFVYGMSSAQQYAWLKEHRPEVYAKVKDAVAAGRFLPLGGMWVESDTTMPSGEAMARQFLYGQRFFETEFGCRSNGVWLPDSFGYSAALPQLIRRAGFSWFFTQKISWNQVNVFPHHTFDWEGIDGSRVFTHFPPMDTYNSELSGAEVAKASRQFREARLASGSIAPTGWGDGGGGSTREMVGRASRLANLEGSARVRWEHPDDFYARAHAELPQAPVWVGELYLEMHRGTLTSQHRTKAGQRRIEKVRIEAEALALIAQAQAILAAPDAEAQGDDGGSPEPQAVVFNASPYPVDGVAGLSAGVPVAPDDAVTLTATLEGWTLANGLVRVGVDADGLIVSAVDDSSGRELIPAGAAANLLQIHPDFPNRWDAWDVDRFYRNRVTDLRGHRSLRADLTDGVASVRVERAFGDSQVVQTLRLRPGSRTLEIDQVTDWHESETFLKVAFPLDLFAESTLAETQFGAVRRVTHTNTSWEAAKFETSMHRFVLAEEAGGGAALVTDSTYGFDVSRQVGHDGTATQVTTNLRLSLLRAPRFPDPQTDQGEQRHRYGLVIGADIEDATREGYALNTARRPHLGREVPPLVAASDGIVISAIKLAADRSGDLIVRVYEPYGRRARGTLRLARPAAAVWEASLIEDRLGTPVAEQAEAIPVALTPFEVRTCRMTL